MTIASVMRCIVEAWRLPDTSLRGQRIKRGMPTHERLTQNFRHVRCGDTCRVRRYLSRVMVDGNVMVIAEMIESTARINDGEVVESFFNP
jgi:hypothetical protein